VSALKNADEKKERKKGGDGLYKVSRTRGKAVAV